MAVGVHGGGLHPEARSLDESAHQGTCGPRGERASSQQPAADAGGMQQSEMGGATWRAGAKKRRREVQPVRG
jgi:hypothetical protein